MRLDKFLKVSRIIKRRAIAKKIADQGRIMINDKVAKSSSDVRVGDVLTIEFGNKTERYRLTSWWKRLRRTRQPGCTKF